MVQDKEDRGDSAETLCPTCGKRIVPGRNPGSLTSYLFGAFDCTCSRAGAAQQAPPTSALSLEKVEDDFCPKCGLRLADSPNVGTLTAFLFQDTRCKCTPDQAFADGKMSARFWQLKKTGAGTVFSTSSPETDRPNRSKTKSIDLASGAIVGGAYEIISLVGFGNMGEVYLARHTALGKKCALKVIPPDQVTEMGWLRFQLEARTVAKLEHVNLVRVTDLGIHDGCLPFYAMDYVEGENLAELLDEHGPMPLNTTLEIFSQVCDGVYCAHRSGVLHRDIKPANIMVASEKSGSKRAKVLDFGLVKLTNHDRTTQSLTAVGDVFGSPSYMSPEQCSGEKLDHRSDIYSLGCTMFEALTGRPPFVGDLARVIFNGHLSQDPPSLESISGAGKFPASMEVVIAKLLRKNPVERYQTMAEVKGDLERVARGENVDPIYVSRSKGTTTSRKSDQIAPASDSGNANWPLAAKVFVGFATIIIVAGVAGVVAFMAGKGAADKSTVKQIQATRGPEKTATVSPLPGSSSKSEYDLDVPALIDSEDKKMSAAMAWDGKPFYRGIVSHAGKPCKSWVFPQAGGAFLGRMYAAGDDSDLGQLMAGTVYLPASASVEVAPTSAIILWPKLQNGFTDGNIDVLCLRLLTPGYADQLVKALAGLKSLTGLYIYDIRGTDSFFQATCLGIINRYPNLTRLYTNMLGDGRAVRQIHRLKMLRYLHLGEIEKHYDDIFSALRGSTNLTEMQLDDIPLTFSAVRDIVTCSNLESLDCRRKTLQIQFQDFQVDLLARLKKLKKLKLEAISFSPALMEAMGKFQSLRELKCELNTDWSREQRVALRRALPNADLLVYWKSIGGKMVYLHYLPGQDQPDGATK